MKIDSRRTFSEPLQQIIALCRYGRDMEEVVASLRDDKKLVLFGAGTTGLIGKACLRPFDRNVDFFVDNDPKKIDLFLEGIPVLSAEQIVKWRDEIDILLSSYAVPDIVMQLHELGLGDCVRGSLLTALDQNLFDHWLEKIHVVDEKVEIPVVSYCVMGRCNLRCEYCTTFSPFRSDLCQVEPLFESYELWNKKIRPEQLQIMGGELLLHPQYEEILRQTVRSWPDSEVVLYTNGTLLDGVRDAFLHEMSRHRFTLTVSRHIDTPAFNEKLAKSFHRARQHGVQIREINALGPWWKIYQTDADGTPLPSHSDARSAWRNCPWKKCVVLDGNRLYRCASVFHAIRAFEEKVLDDAWKDVLLHSPVCCDATLEEIVSYLNAGAMEECRLCPKSFDYVPARQLMEKEIEAALKRF